jgi:predicted negative regulator of RcsB-dependent stress response
MANEEVQNTLDLMRAKITTLRKMTDDLCVAFEAQERELLAERASLDAAAELVKNNASELYERELKVSRREREVQNIRQIAAERKAQVVTAQQSADTAHEERRKAEVSMRMAQSEKSRLEEMVTTLIREKRELQDCLSAARLVPSSE